MKHIENLFLIIEGIDNVGKGTLITNLKNHFNKHTLHVLHYSNVKMPASEVQGYSTKMYIEMFQLMQKINQGKMGGVICDRSHIGEMVYGPMYRDYNGSYVLRIEELFHEDKEFWDNVMLITLYDDAKAVIRRDDKKSFTVDLDKKEEEIKRFIEAHNASSIERKLLLDISKHDEQQAINAVIEFIQI